MPKHDRINSYAAPSHEQGHAIDYTAGSIPAVSMRPNPTDNQLSRCLYQKQHNRINSGTTKGQTTPEHDRINSYVDSGQTVLPLTSAKADPI
jgi:hypothetical protein